MSLAKIKAKETKSKLKTKVKVNKVKIFLANPLKPKCSSLEDSDLKKLQQLLQNSIKESKQLPRVFATTRQICLGLESSLRTINKGEAACVLLSSKITPRYILRLLARNIETKCQWAPTYVEKELEDITESIFGIRTLAMVLPINYKDLGAELVAWIDAHKKSIIRKKVEPNISPIKTKNRLTDNPPLAQLKTLSVTSETLEEEKNEEEVKPWGSNYISFGKTDKSMDLDAVNPEEDEDKLLGALNQIAKKAKLEQASSDSLTPVFVKSKEEMPLEKPEIEPSDSDQDDFLSGYAPLTVHKICPNPDRKPRKKRKKNRKANKTQ